MSAALCCLESFGIVSAAWCDLRLSVRLSSLYSHTACMILAGLSFVHALGTSLSVKASICCSPIYGPSRGEYRDVQRNSPGIFPGILKHRCGPVLRPDFGTGANWTAGSRSMNKVLCCLWLRLILGVLPAARLFAHPGLDAWYEACTCSLHQGFETKGL